MRPYVERILVEGLIEASVERAWAFRLDPAAQVAAYSHRLEVTPIAGTMGEVGSVVRYVSVLESGETATATSTVTAIDPPRRAVLDGQTFEAPDVRTTSIFEFEPAGDATRISVTLEFRVDRTNWLQRFALRSTRELRRSEGERLFAFELAEENAYHRAHPA